MSRPVIYNKHMSDEERDARRRQAAQAAEQRAEEQRLGGELNL